MNSQRINKMAASLQNKYILHDKADFSMLQDNHLYEALQKINRDPDMIKTFLIIEDEFYAEKLAKMNAEYNRFLAVEKQQLDQYRFSTEIIKTYSQAVLLHKPAARPEKQLSDADGWKKVKRWKMKSTDVRDDERCDLAFIVVKARAGKPRGALAARLPVASTAKVDFSGARSHPHSARATGELVSLSPPARVGGAVPPLGYPLPNSSCVVEEKDAEPVSSENTAQESKALRTWLRFAGVTAPLSQSKRLPVPKEAKRAYRSLCKEKKASLQELLDRKILMEAESYCHRFLRLNGSSSGTVTNDINMDTYAQFGQLGGLFNSRSLGRERRIELALGGMKNRKTPGPDNLQNEVVRLLWAALPNDITAFLNVCVKLGSFPVAWKISNLKLLYNGKGAVSDVNSYRGINL
ncbi:Hypothetical predicted protein [Cloeon dipterum]|uniref:Uncharacterized protein n=1 Tax=Cloeon dipterum TaxID=197152 RepID=A0A8S1E2T9_9INSE|nr:Hypothetical predicted protein [Cloeon dipterum]